MKLAPQKMHVAYLFANFLGGSPRSLKEYMKIAEQTGYRTTVLTPATDCIEIIDSSKAEIDIIPQFTLRRIGWVLNSYFTCLRLMRKRNIDLIHVNRIDYFPLATALGRARGVGVIYTYADTTIPDKRWLLGMDKNAIITTYCQDYLDRLIGAGINAANVRIWPQRFDLNLSSSSKPKNNWSNVTEMAIVSRLDPEKLGSIIEVLKITHQLSLLGQKFMLHIVGDGVCRQEVERFAISLQENSPSRIFEFHGYVSPVSSITARCQVIFGKGRTVIEAIIEKKIAIIVSEESKYSIVRSSKFWHQSSANFSGRNIYQSDTLEDLVNVLMTPSEFDKELEELSFSATKLYCVSQLRSKLIKLYEDTFKIHRPKNLISSLSFLVFESILASLKHLQQRRKN